MTNRPLKLSNCRAVYNSQPCWKSHHLYQSNEIKDLTESLKEDSNGVVPAVPLALIEVEVPDDDVRNPIRDFHPMLKLFGIFFHVLSCIVFGNILAVLDHFTGL